MANGVGLSISHIGHTKIYGLGTSLNLKNILHVPHINKHLLSANKLESDNDVFIEIHKHAFFCQGQGHEENSSIG